MINKYGIGVVAVDYDGTLTLKDNYPHVGPHNSRAVAILKEFRSRGGKLILWTLRTNGELKAAVESLRSLGLEFDAVNCNLDEQQRNWLSAHPECGVSNKCFANLYIDDRSPSAMLHGIDWGEIEELLLSED